MVPRGFATFAAFAFVLLTAETAARADPPDFTRHEAVDAATTTTAPPTAPFAPAVALVAPLPVTSRDTALTLYGGTDPLGVTLAAAEVAAGVTLARSFGPLRLAATAALTHAMGPLDDASGDIDATATVALSPRVSIGAAVHTRSELQDEIKTVEDDGRRAEVVGGALGIVDLGAVQVTTLAGAMSPRGFAPPGPVSLTRMGVSF